MDIITALNYSLSSCFGLEVNNPEVLSFERSDPHFLVTFFRSFGITSTGHMIKTRQ